MTILFALLLQFQVYIPMVTVQNPCTCPSSTTTTTTSTTTTTIAHEALTWLSSEPGCLTFNGQAQVVTITGRGFFPGIKVFVGTMGYFQLAVIDQHNATFTIPGDYLQSGHFGWEVPESILAYLTAQYSDSDYFFFCIQGE